MAAVDDGVPPGERIERETVFRFLQRQGVGSTFNFPYPDPKKVRELLERAGVSNFLYRDEANITRVLSSVGIDLRQRKAILGAVLSRAYQDIFPSIDGRLFFERNGVDAIGDVVDRTIPGIVVTYDNSFGWGKNGEYDSSLASLSTHPEFSDHDLTIRLEATERAYLPRTEKFNAGSLCGLILGDGGQKVIAANPGILPFFYFHGRDDKDGYAEVGMCPRNPTYGNVQRAAAILRTVLVVLQRAEEEFKEYEEAVQHDSEQQQEDAATNISALFEAHGLRGRIARYFTHPTEYTPSPRKKRSFDDEPF